MRVDIRTFSEDSEVAELIHEAEAAGELPRIPVGNARYVVVRENGTGGDDPRDFDPALVSDSEKIWENYDPDRLVRAFRESAGVFHGIDGDQLLSDLREQRGQESSGRPA